MDRCEWVSTTVYGELQRCKNPEDILISPGADEIGVCAGHVKDAILAMVYTFDVPVKVKRARARGEEELSNRDSNT